MKIKIQPSLRLVKMQLKNFEAVKVGIWNNNLKQAAETTVACILEEFFMELKGKI